jgi:hypothetical protein
MIFFLVLFLLFFLLFFFLELSESRVCVYVCVCVLWNYYL